MIAQQTLQKLQKFDTPTICNLIELFGRAPAERGLHGRPYRGRFPRNAADRWLCGHGHLPLGRAAGQG